MSVSRTISKIYTEEAFQMLDRADMLIDEDKDDKAIELYTNVINVYPEEPYAYAMRGWVLIKQKKYELAIQDFSISLEKVPNAINTLWLRARAYESIGKLHKAKEDYKKYIQLEPNDREAYFNIGLIYEYEKDYGNALVNFKQANNLKHSNNLDKKIEDLSSRRGNAVVPDTEKS